MKEYYENRIKQIEKQLELVKIGFETKIEFFGKEIQKCKTTEQTDNVLKEIKEYREAIADIESSLASNKEYYEKEYCINESKEDCAKKILFGGTDNGR